MSPFNPGARREFLSGARLAGLRLAVSWEREALDEELRGWGPFRAAALEGLGRQHPLCLELWFVSEGRLELGGADQHQWCASIGAAQGALLERLLLGAGAGRIRETCGAGARALSGLASGWLGTYHELMLSVPGVVCEGLAGQHTLVVGMLTDSWLARWGDAALGFGYRKRPGRFATDRALSWRVFTGAEELLSVQAEPGGAAGAEALPELASAWREPLLGVSANGRWAVSHLQRDLRAPGAGVMAVGGTLGLAAPLPIGPGAGSHELLTWPEAGGWGSFYFCDVPARISYPARLAARREPGAGAPPTGLAPEAAGRPAPAPGRAPEASGYPRSASTRRPDHA